MSSRNNKKTIFVDAPPQDVKLRKLTTRPMSAFEERDQRWLWRPFIPLGTVTSMFGDGGVGKSTVTYDWMARLTTKRPMPNRTKGVSGSVLIMASEDTVETTIKPRLRAAGADMDRVFALGYDDPHNPKNFDPIEAISTHLKDLEEIIVERGDVKLLVIDPLADFSGDLKLDKNEDVRKIMRPLRKLAQQYELAVIVVYHINKNPDQAAHHRGMGSLAMRNVPRSSLLVAIDPISPVTRRIMVQTKANLSPSDNSAIGFEIMATGGGKVIRIQWDNEMTDADPDELLSKKLAKEKSAQPGDQVPTR